MPIYEYECEKCCHHFEVMQSFNDEPIHDCPVCRGQVRRVIQPVGIVFKGSGFYVTDNRKGGNDYRSSTGSNGSKKKEPQEKEKISSPTTDAVESKTTVETKTKED